VPPHSLRLDDGAGGTVSAVVHRPGRPRGPAFLLAHGAGGSLDTPGLVALCEVLADLGHLAVRFNLPYREAGRRTPPRADLATDGLAAIARAAKVGLAPRRRWVLGGKSYGGRVASLAVADGLPAAGLLFYGYPLHPPGRPERLRADHWAALSVPGLFLQGDRDPFCDLALLRHHGRRWAGRLTVDIVTGGDHSLRVAGAASPDGRARGEIDVITALGPSIRAWIDTI